ncbi:hypothetical protein SLEP1_g57897 [Rubroshorea leprosula]|uniref:Secreted protein n=1 Tax=Rubroshorea leprosula TaxID=152421 RepID=A0AAV5MQW0_9ROSI|nr:hypothetical protein SLEP1_g57897 [Rubroshorea leprosula]
MTVGMLGLSFANSCTHSNPTCMHLRTSSRWDGSATMLSTKATMLPSFHNFQAWKGQRLASKWAGKKGELNIRLVKERA